MRKHEYKFEGKVFKRTAKNHAYKLIEQGKQYFLVGANVNDFHFHSGWHLATFPTKSDIEEAEKMYNGFACYLERELGRYPIFYVEC